jgi:hypothetical protein
VVDALRPDIHPRADWAHDREVRGELTPEDDVRFLMVHHTASTNDYGPDEVAGQIQLFYDYHTSPEKGWPDVAYNFFVDRYGGVWEGRQGSLDGPVRGDATGGSQGFALLCSLIGDFSSEPITAEQQASLVVLLAWLGEQYHVDTTPGAEVAFVSRGSNLWPTGSEVRAATIAGHRDMSKTSCPGDSLYGLIDVELPTAVTDLRMATAAEVAREAAGSGEAPGGDESVGEGNPPSTTADSTSTTSSSGIDGERGGGESAAPSPSTTVPGDSGENQVAAGLDGGEDDGGGPSGTTLLAGGAAAAAAAGAAAAALAGRNGLDQDS